MTKHLKILHKLTYRFLDDEEGYDWSIKTGLLRQSDFDFVFRDILKYKTSYDLYVNKECEYDDIISVIDQTSKTKPKDLKYFNIEDANKHIF